MTVYGKHIIIKNLAKADLYTATINSNKHTFAVVLLVTVDSEYRFITVDVEAVETLI